MGEKGGKFADLTDANRLFDEVYAVHAGKYRRYHGERLLERLLDVKTLLLNLRDFWLFVGGTVEAWRLLGKVKPDVVFLKGGFVGVPVGLAAAMRGLPIVTHDSDALPGLANRLISHWARIHAVALPESNYAYPVEKMRHVGVLVEAAYQPVTLKQQLEFKKMVGIPTNQTVLLVTGGSLGATPINEAMVKSIKHLLDAFPGLYVVHQVGRGKTGVYNGYTHERLKILEFLKPMHAFMGAADLVVARASANTVAEIGVQGKPMIVVPGFHLAGGHQLKNAEALVKQGSALVVQEDKLYNSQHGLLATISQLLNDKDLRKKIARNLQSNTRTDAAPLLADLLIEQYAKTHSEDRA